MAGGGVWYPVLSNCSTVLGACLTQSCVRVYWSVHLSLPHACAALLEVGAKPRVQFLLFKIFFLMWTIFKVFIKSVIVLLLVVFFCQEACGSEFLTRDRTCTHCFGRQSLNHWTTREVPCSQFLYR